MIMLLNFLCAEHYGNVGSRHLIHGKGGRQWKVQQEASWEQRHLNRPVTREGLGAGVRPLHREQKSTKEAHVTTAQPFMKY